MQSPGPCARSSTGSDHAQAVEIPCYIATRAHPQLQVPHQPSYIQIFVKPQIPPQLLYLTFLAEFFLDDELDVDLVYYSEMKDAGYFQNYDEGLQ